MFLDGRPLLSGEVILARQPGISLNFLCNKSQLFRVCLTLAPHFSFRLEGGTDELQRQLYEWLLKYREGTAPVFPLELPLQTFSTQVLNYLTQIPFGKTASYSEVAAALGNPKGARAVGNACRANPFPFLIPCHRVISASGRLGGFSPQLIDTVSKNLQERSVEQQELKRRLLKFEGAI